MLLPCSDNCDLLEVERVRRKFGVVVPMPRDPRKYELVVVVAIKFPTVSCEVVAVKAVPAALETMIEFGEKEVAPVPPFPKARVPETSAMLPSLYLATGSTRRPTSTPSLAASILPLPSASTRPTSCRLRQRR